MSVVLFGIMMMVIVNITMTVDAFTSLRPRRRRQLQLQNRLYVRTFNARVDPATVTAREPLNISPSCPGRIDTGKKGLMRPLGPLYMNDNCPEEDRSDDETTTAIAGIASPNVFPWASFGMMFLPFLSFIFPYILGVAKSLPANSSQQLQVVTLLFVSSRIYLYLNAAIIVAVASIRGSMFDSSKLGTRLTDLTEELLYRPDLSIQARRISGGDSGDSYSCTGQEMPDKDRTQRPDLIQAISTSGLGEKLDDMSADRQALVLPLLVSTLLAVSVFLVPFWTLIQQQPQQETQSFLSFDGILGIDLTGFVKNLLPYVSQIWNAGLLALFTRAEIRWLLFEFSSSLSSSRSSADKSEGQSSSLNSPSTIPNDYSVYFEWGLAAAITAVACFTPFWPVQNFVNMALAVAVARAIQLDRFPAVVLALLLLTIYDASSVFLIPSAGALTSNIVEATDVFLPVQHMASVDFSVDNEWFRSSSSSSSSLMLGGVADSAMGSVAIQKLKSGVFQPGLLQTRIDDRFLGGSLGLGDAVFPSLLTVFVRKFDLDHKNLKRKNNANNEPALSLFTVSMVAYLLGCGSCELIPATLSSTGLPALLFIIPVMLLSVITAAAATGNLESLWNYQPADETE